MLVQVEYQTGRNPNKEETKRGWPPRYCGEVGGVNALCFGSQREQSRSKRVSRYGSDPVCKLLKTVSRNRGVGETTKARGWLNMERSAGYRGGESVLPSYSVTGVRV